MNILSIDSSTKRLSVAVSRNERLLSEITGDGEMNHMVNIMGVLDLALSKSKLTLKEIDVFGVNSGPGDFTGTRIGISVIKILSWLEEKPAYGISSLDAVALGISLKNSGFITRALSKNSSVLVMPCMDVRREEVYFAFYNITRESDNKSRGTDDKDSYLARIGSGRMRCFVKKAGGNFLTRYDNLKSFLNKSVENGILKVPGSSVEYMNPEILIGGNCHLSYGKILSDIVRHERIFSLDKKNACPQAGYLNICAYFNALKKVETKNIVPAYVREFIPFGAGRQQDAQPGKYNRVSK